MVYRDGGTWSAVCYASSLCEVAGPVSALLCLELRGWFLVLVDLPSNLRDYMESICSDSGCAGPDDAVVCCGVVVTPRQLMMPGLLGCPFLSCFVVSEGSMEVCVCVFVYGGGGLLPCAHTLPRDAELQLR